MFDDDCQLIDDETLSSRWNVTKARQTEALGIVLTAVDCDAIMIFEAPDSSRTRSTKRALQNVADNFGLCTNTASIGFPNDTQQEIV